MKRKRLLTAAAGTLLAAAIAGVAWAAIPGPGNVYTACMLKGLGTIRLIDKSLPASNLMSHCTAKETEISWNQEGQPGPAGPQGPQGDAGAQGPAGPKGDPGPGLAALGDLAGLPCRTPQFEGQVAVDTTPLALNSARVELRCHVPNSAVLRLRLINASVGHPSGRVTGLPSDCVLPSGHIEVTCDYAVRVGDELTLVAESGAGSAFVQWASGPCAYSVEPTCTFVVAGDDEIVLGFTTSP